MMLFINRQYRASKARAGRPAGRGDPRPAARGAGHRARCPGINRAVVHAINVGLSIDPNVQAVLISDEPEEAAAIRSRWERQMPEVPLVIVESPYRALVAPLVSYLDVLDRGWPVGQGGADHVRRHPGVRGEELVGADPVQPVREAPSRRAARPSAHRRRERAVPARDGRSVGGVFGGSAAAVTRFGPGRSRDLAALLVIAAFVRIVGLLGPGHSGDLFAFVTWAEDAARHGLGAYYAAGGDSNYPPMLYLLWPLGVALDDGPLQFAIRTLSIPFDLGLGALLYFVARAATGRARDGLLSAGFYLLNPAVVLTGPMWGQVDGMGALPMVGALVAVARGRVVSAGVLAVLAGLVKPQFGVAAFVLAGLVVFWLRSPDGIRRAAMLGLAGLVTFVVVLAPLGLGPLGYLDLMGETFGRYPVHSGFAFNPWGMVFGFDHPDGDWFRVGTVARARGHRRQPVAAARAPRPDRAARRRFVDCADPVLRADPGPRAVPVRAIALLAPLAVIEPRLRRPFYALSATFFVTLAYVIANSPYRILWPDRVQDFPGWAISLMSAVTTLSGAWVAWRLVDLLRRGQPSRSQNGLESARGRRGPIPSLRGRVDLRNTRRSSHGNHDRPGSCDSRRPQGGRRRADRRIRRADGRANRRQGEREGRLRRADRA